MNVGLVIFLVGLAGTSPEIKRIGAPLMGVGIVLGLATIAMRLWASRLQPDEGAARPEMASAGG